MSAFIASASSRAAPPAPRSGRGPSSHSQVSSRLTSTASWDRDRELAAVGVLTAFRRRGIASAVSAHLARTAHARGIKVVFLEALPDEEEIYRRTGFADVSAKVWLSLR